MTFFIALFILLMQFLWKYIDDLVGKGLEWYTIAELLAYASSTFVPLGHVWRMMLDVLSVGLSNGDLNHLFTHWYAIE